MTYMLIVGLLIIFIVGILFGMGLAQAADKEMPKPPYMNNRTIVIYKVDAEAVRQAIQDADDNEGWG